MNALTEIAANWGAEGPVELISERENTVYRIMCSGTPAALRLHRAGYQKKAAILSELSWTTRLADAGFACPKPIAQQDGTFIAQLADCRFASVISWVEGAPIGEPDVPFDGTVKAHCDLYHNLGHLISNMLIQCINPGHVKRYFTTTVTTTCSLS